ncbi:MAG: hypothetical protein NTY12_02740 [Candidatus Falkowbacteria bacterium]|nr:hypothetical protein [Candidatus Falkowbacteria bacterium]
MNSTNNTNIWLEDLVLRGIDLSKFIEPAIDGYGRFKLGSGMYSDYSSDGEYVSEVMGKYLIWLDDIKNAIEKYKIDKIANAYFWQADGVPRMIISGPDYWNINDDKPQKLLKKIYEETLIKNNKLSDLGKIINVVKNKTTKKITIYISKDEGIYINKDRKYPIKKGRFDLIQKLRGEKIVMPRERINYSNPLKEIKKINENFKEGLNLKEDIIIHVSTGGYRLNRNNYEINFID